MRISAGNPGARTAALTSQGQANPTIFFAAQAFGFRGTKAANPKGYPMSQRIVSAIVFLLLTFCAQVFSQDCQDCKTRKVILYDNEVTVPRPSANPDSIYRYWDYFFITGGVKSYLSSQDPTRDCIRRMDGAFFTEKDSVTSNIKYGAEHANLPPSGEVGNGFPTYLLYGVVSSTQVTLKLETGKTRELVKSVSMALPVGFNPIDVGKILGASLGPLYTTIIDFEMKKRDQGEPYAIQPKLTFTPAKAKLNSNEKTTVEALFLDCDGVALKNRNVTFTVTGGTTNPQSSVTTDDQGKATIEFTAGQTSTLATITAVYPFQKATGYMDVAEVTPGIIQINKPNDSWYVFGELKVTNDYTTDYTDQFGVNNSVDHEETRIQFGAWLKNISPGIGGSGSNFVADPLNYEITYTGSENEWSNGHQHSEFGAAFIDRTSNYTRTAVAGSATAAKLALSIGWDSYSFTINNITANQSGGGDEVEVTDDPISGPQTTTSHTTVLPTTKLSLSVQGKNRDTTITTNEVTENPALGKKETKTSGSQQKASWKDNTWTLTFDATSDDITRTELNFTEVARWHQVRTARLNLSYTGDPPTGVEAEKQIVPAVFALSQNYPNPFNPATTISYILPLATRTSLIVADLLGRKVATLVDGEKPAGLHVVTWNATGLPSGVYFLQMRSGGFVETRKLLLAK